MKINNAWPIWLVRCVFTAQAVKIRKQMSAPYNNDGHMQY